MKVISIILVLYLSPFLSNGQNFFELKSEVGLKTIKINGKEYNIESSKQLVKTNFPDFDTLYFDSEEPIICNFKPDSSYSLIMACCGSTDIVSSYKYEITKSMNFESEKDIEEIKSVLLDQPYLFINTINNFTDSIYAWNSDAACQPVFNKLDKEFWKMGQPPKCYYWSNINYILFFQKDTKYSSINDKDDDIESLLEIDGVHRLKYIAIRFFDNEHFEITFDKSINEIFIIKKTVHNKK